ncbi:hypothetical protein AKJ09_06694 [Labilithrix luteola]|uniref:Uncharacterized protein n=1 Tax=Labilithrix luteola TaxID=1391654 RepID=A0A0K1Q2I9_9BACT|nr:hypothetical protein AKJ09_06694 [Labilithrix luteola]
MSAGAALAPGCYGHNCDGEIVQYGAVAGQGHLLNVDTWESNPIDGPWLPFPKQRMYQFDLRALGNRPPQIILPYLSAQSDPLHEFGNFTIGGGNLTELSGATNGVLTVKNGTCADYFLRVVVQAAPVPTAPVPNGDASTTSATDSVTNMGLADSGADDNAVDASDADADDGI